MNESRPCEPRLGRRTIGRGTTGAKVSFTRARAWKAVICLTTATLLAPSGVGSLLLAQAPVTVQAAASTQAPSTTIAVDVKVVTLPVTVRDKHGKIVVRRASNIFRKTQISPSHSVCSSTPAAAKLPYSKRSATQAALFSIKCWRRKRIKLSSFTLIMK